MKLSPEGVDLLKWIEQPRLKPYDDQTSKPITAWCKGATIGYGHLISAADWSLYKDGIDVEEMEELFYDDLTPREKVVNETITVPLEQRQYDALILLLYNLGTRQFQTSLAIKMINDPSAKTAFSSLENAWKAFNKTSSPEKGTYISKGLVNRRAAEWKLYSTGTYGRW